MRFKSLYSLIIHEYRRETKQASINDGLLGVATDEKANGER